jgi:hypothetical protein
MSKRTDLPDAYAESDGNNTLVVANKKARRFLNRHFDKHPPRWDTVGGGVFTSPQYRAIQIEDGPGPQVLLAAVHRAGMVVMFKCISCPHLHTLTDEKATQFLREAEACAEWVGAHPGVRTVQ